MAPIMPVSAPLAGGSKNAIARCVVTKYPRMRCVSVVCSPGVATSSRPRTELTCQDSRSKLKGPGILTACSCLASGYQLSNDHVDAYPGASITCLERPGLAPLKEGLAFVEHRMEVVQWRKSGSQ